MKLCKAAGPSGIVVEMIKAAVDTGTTLTSNLDTDCEQSAIVCLYKSKVDVLNRGNYGPQADQTAQEDPREDCRWSHKQVLSTDHSQFRFVPERGTTDAILWSGS